MKYLTKNIADIDTLTRNIHNTLLQASDDDYESGLNWYNSAHTIARKLGRKYGLDYVKTAGVLSALSPRNKWQRNVADADNLLADETVKVSTFNANKTKAIDIKNGANIPQTLKGNKTVSFWKNIVNPGCAETVTVDTWAYIVANGPLPDDTKLSGLTDNTYNELVQAYKNVAAIVGLLPQQVQAITWIVVRRQYGYVD